MKKRFKIINLIFLVIIIFLISYLFVNIFIGNTKFQNLKSFLNFEQKQFIKRYIFPHKFISEQEKEFESTLLKTQQEFNSILLDLELEKIQNKDDIKIRESRVKLSNNYILKKYKLTTGFYLGINNLYPGSGYIDFYEDNIFIISSRGLLAFGKNFSKDNKNFKQIKNNIHDFIDLDQFKKLKDFSLKDILIFKDKVFISYTELIREDCWNTSIIYGVIDYENIKFKKLYSPDECVHLVNNIDKDFNAHQSGGRIISFEDDSILFSIGDYRSRYLAQDQKSINGKIIQININNGNFRIISIGHRNPQGLYFDRENNFILETEHGPMGGDEINLIELDKMNKDNFLNYGWPISSYGEHYSGVIKKNRRIYKKYPLYKSHNDHGFIEPLKAFVPSIGISEIVRIKQNQYVLSSLKDKSLYFFELDKQKKIINLNRVEVFERIRDLKFKDKKLYLFMEDTASIGVIDISK